ncbi:ATP-grasp domain-containing protein [Streptantibioticus cattleyicolor]|uniref:ATP-grasp domain-containing protein n=1 Tax=Streptantibioticus cattleyicolor (strain ATCC 35852 / DSM 46488 / JCM 4925 / NBRC 14057 / NRRL 8057) TaxID=1003195 RepID=F8JL08_STREN|nr:hypothetical protein [Streptantibioticus cattleyicolor]AEW99633.1 hypothetical protein SCATT_p14400 [Streptantibioticus cattleyicolor NRRL 8057 = DSM 46488]CCB71330.1 conserved protein of unknown function [Streptantibioticus cattleyicolor NRRL 8057 = DSM 46488]
MGEPSGPHRVLLTETTSASAREVLTVLGHLGHRVGVLDAGGMSFTRGSRWVARRHRVPPFNAGPLRWLDALAGVLAGGGYDVVLPTHEQLSALSAHRERFAALVPGLAVPEFAAVRRAQDKAEAVALLDEAGLARPETAVVTSPGELAARDDLLPGYVKLPVATASRGVWRVGDAAELRRVAALPEVFAGDGRVVLQRALAGPVAMVSAVFDRGRPVGAHVVVRRRDGFQGGAAAKESVRLPDVERDLAALGRTLRWHGPLSADAVLVGEARVAHYIDLNPRLVEPVNAHLAGAALVERWLDVSTGRPVGDLVTGAAGVRTHALLLAVLGAAADGRGRRGVAAELARAAARRGWYARSAEELTPWADPLSRLPPALAAGVLLVRPAAWPALAGTGVPPHALTAAGWRELTDRAG